MDAKKYCSDCGADRPVSEFTKDRRRRDGLAFYCRTHARLRLRASKARRQGLPRSRHKPDAVVPEGFKWCPDCGEVKPLAKFPSTRANVSGRHSYCKPCHNPRGRATLEKLGGSRTYHLKRRYGITARDADALPQTRVGCARSARCRRPSMSTTITKPARSGPCSASTATAGWGSSRTIQRSCTPPRTTCSSTPSASRSRRSWPRPAPNGRAQPPGHPAGRVAATPRNAAQQRAEHRAEQRCTPASAGGRGG